MRERAKGTNTRTSKKRLIKYAVLFFFKDSFRTSGWIEALNFNLYTRIYLHVKTCIIYESSVNALSYSPNVLLDKLIKEAILYTTVLLHISQCHEVMNIYIVFNQCSEIRIQIL